MKLLAATDSTIGLEQGTANMTHAGEYLRLTVGGEKRGGPFIGLVTGNHAYTAVVEDAQWTEDELNTSIEVALEEALPVLPDEEVAEAARLMVRQLLAECAPLAPGTLVCVKDGHIAEVM